jgi:hypothetical protein
MIEQVCGAQENHQSATAKNDRVDKRTTKNLQCRCDHEEPEPKILESKFQLN